MGANPKTGPFITFTRPFITFKPHRQIFIVKYYLQIGIRTKNGKRGMVGNMQKICEKLTGKLCRDNIIKEENAEIYEYGIYQLFVICINILTAAAIGLAFGQLWQCALFMAVFIPMRSFAGGYHAKTQNRCYVISAFIIAAAMAVIKFLDYSYFVYALGICAVGILQIWLAPCENENKPLSQNEKRVYRVKALIHTFAFMFIMALFLCFGVTWVSDTILTALLVQSIMLAIGSAANYKRQKNI